MKLNFGKVTPSALLKSRWYCSTDVQIEIDNALPVIPGYFAITEISLRSSRLSVKSFALIIVRAGAVTGFV